ncbi:MAG TPA: hypothetical protein VFP56_12235 [Candidatus Limnocylindrales bacterium]|nr:hypothetical protein [Candidatus Limnocylindrales bacterium]
MITRLALPPMVIALANLAALGLMIGWVGASRAYSVGVHTLVRDHLPAVALTLAGTAVLSFFPGRTLRRGAEVVLLVGFALAADVVAALVVTVMFDEMRRVFEVALPRAIFTETVGGLQLLAIAVGAMIGYVSRRPVTTSPESVG